jgi:hypothetical protein
MSIRYPVRAAVRSNANDIPKPKTPHNTIGIFDDFGYWVTFGYGPLELPGDNLDLGNKIAAFINKAYRDGQADAQKTLREALGIVQED